MKRFLLLLLCEVILMGFQFDPATGWLNETEFLDNPVSPRADLQKLHDQTKAYLNNHAVYIADTSTTADAITITPDDNPTAYSTKMSYVVKKNTLANTGAMTINVYSLGVKSVVKDVSVALSAGDAPASGILFLQYDGTNFQLLNPAKSNAFDTHLADVMQRAINVMYPPLPLKAAKGDGIADDYTALQAIIEYAVTNKISIFLPSGTYLVGTGLTVYTGLTLFGQNRDSTIIKASSGINVLSAVNQTGGNVVLKEFTIDGANASNNGIYFDSTRYENKIERVLVKNCIVSGINFNTECYMNTITNCYIKDNDTGIIMGGGSYDITLNDNLIFSNRIGVEIKSTATKSSGGNLLINNDFSDNDIGILLTLQTNDISDIIITENYFENNITANIKGTVDTDTYRFKSLVINNNTIACSLNGIYNIDFMGTDLLKVRLDKCSISNNLLDGRAGLTSRIGLRSNCTGNYIVGNGYKTSSPLLNATLTPIYKNTVLDGGIYQTSNIFSTGTGPIVMSQNGTYYRIGVDDAGNLTTSVVAMS